MQRWKTFIWLAFHNKLLTNDIRAKKGMCMDTTCTWGGANSESLLHNVRDCDDTRDLWLSLINPSVHKEFFNLDLQDWLEFNLKNPGLALGRCWSELFNTSC